MAERYDAGRQELAQARARSPVARRPRPEPRAEGFARRRRVVRRLLGDPRGSGLHVLDLQPAREIGRRLAGAEAHEAGICDLRVGRLAQRLVPALRLDHLDGVRGAVLVALVDEVAAGGGDHGQLLERTFCNEHQFYT